MEEENLVAMSIDNSLKELQCKRKEKNEKLEQLLERKVSQRHVCSLKGSGRAGKMNDLEEKGENCYSSVNRDGNLVKKQESCPQMGNRHLFHCNRFDCGNFWKFFFSSACFYFLNKFGN